MSRSELAGLAEWAEAQLPRLIDDVYSATLERIALYRTDDIVPHDDLRRSIAMNLRFITAAIADPHAAADLSAPSGTGRRRARQGVPLPEVLQVYRMGFAMLWDALVLHTRRDARPGVRDALLAAASMIWQLADEHALALTEAYRAATAELLSAQLSRRSALVEALLTGEPRLEGGPWEAGKLLGLPLDAQLVVVVAETPGLAEENLAGIEHRLAERGIVSAWRLTPAAQLGVVSLRPEQRDTVLEVLRLAASGRTGVSPPYWSLVDTPRNLQLARVALAGIPAGRDEVRMFSSSPLIAFLAGDPEEGQRLAEEVLGPVLDLTGDDRTALLNTLQAFLDHAGSAERTAEVLQCHPNTVRYRLRRVQELTGRSLADPGALAELAAAAYALRLNPGGRAGGRAASPAP